MNLETGEIDWQNPIADHPLNSGLVAWWLAGGEGSGPFWGGPKLRDLRDKNNATLTNGPAWQGARGRPGELGSLNYTAASSQYVNVSSFSWPTGGPVTVAFWTKTPGGTAGGAFGFGGQNFPDRFFAHVPYLDNNLYWDYGDLASGRISANFSSYVNLWTHVVLCSAGRSGAFKAIYLNGVVANSSSGASEGPTIALTGGRIGSGDTAAAIYYNNGPLDDFRCYSRVLDAASVAALYSQSRRGYPDLLRRLTLPVWVSTGGTVTESPSVISLAAAVLASTLTLTQAGTPLSIVGGVLQPAQTLTQAPATVAAAAAVLAPALATAQAPAAVSAAAAVLAPSTTLLQAPSALTATFDVPAVTTSGDIVETPATLTLAGSVLAPGVSLTQAVGVLTVTAAVVATPTTALSAAPAPVTGVAAVVAPAVSLTQAVSTVTATFTVPSVTAARVETPGAVAATLAVLGPATTLTLSPTPVSGAFTVLAPFVVTLGLDTMPLRGRVSVTRTLRGALQALTRLRGRVDVTRTLTAEVMVP